MMTILQSSLAPLPFPLVSSLHTKRWAPSSTFKISAHKQAQLCRTSLPVCKAKKLEEEEELDIDDDENYSDDEEEEDDGQQNIRSRRKVGGREHERDYDKDPEFAEILGSCLDDPQKARSKVVLNSIGFNTYVCI